MARYTLKEFEAAGLEPQKCDSGPYGSHIAPEEPEYWSPCTYHEGYIDGFENGAPNRSVESGQTAQGVTE